MYFVRLYYQNARLNQSGRFEIPRRCGGIPKWSIFSPERRTLELFRLITLAALNPPLVSELGFPLERLIHCSSSAVQLEFELFHHPETEGKSKHPHLPVGSGMRLFPDGATQCLTQRECDFLNAAGIYRKTIASRNPVRRFLLAYGARFSTHDGTDDFDFTDPYYALSRCRTLFLPHQKLTDPAAFLKRMHYKGLKCGRIAPRAILQTLVDLLGSHLKIDASTLLDPSCDLEHTWRRQPAIQRRMIVPLLDICRHLYDAFPKSRNPTMMPGLIILHRPEGWCTDNAFPAWIRLLDSLLPNMQFFISLSEKATQDFPKAVTRHRLPLPAPKPGEPKRKRTPSLPKKPVLLIQVDGRLPNLALMKLSRYYKEKGKEVVLAKRGARIKKVDRVFASCIYNFESSMARLQALKKYYGGDLRAGGSGVDLALRLPEEIEEMPADYTLYPELGDRAIGFITRGCPHKCPFCLVPMKEGAVHRVSDLQALLGKRRKRLILLDDNLMAHARSEEILEEMASRGLQVNFTQTLDLRHINKRKALLLRSIDCMNTRFSRPNYYFSLNNNKRFALIRNKYNMFGFKSRDNVEFICMYGFDTTLAQDVERFRFLRSLPGAYVFTQKYRPIVPTAPGHDPIPFFGDAPDPLIDELVSIVFTQNMKSMEAYYRWLSRKYAMRFGRLHAGLVDTIFRYNNRHMRGEYIATLAGTRKR